MFLRGAEESPFPLDNPCSTPEDPVGSEPRQSESPVPDDQPRTRGKVVLRETVLGRRHNTGVDGPTVARPVEPSPVERVTLVAALAPGARPGR